MELSKALILIGFSIVVLGVLVWVAQRVPWIYSWFGNLPGDICVEGDRTFIYAPVVSMIVVSVVLSFVGWLVQRVMGR
jgi:hypothetical protein